MKQFGESAANPDQWASQVDIDSVAAKLDEVHVAALTGHRLHGVTLGRATDGSTLELVSAAAKAHVCFTQDQQGVWTVTKTRKTERDENDSVTIITSEHRLVPGEYGTFSSDRLIWHTDHYETPRMGGRRSADGSLLPLTPEDCDNMVSELSGLLTPPRRKKALPALMGLLRRLT